MNWLRQYRFAAFLVGAAMSWGLATVISKRAVNEIAPLLLLPIQLAVSLIVLGVVLAARRDRPARSPGLRRLALLGVLNPGISYALSLLGLAHLTASMSVLLWAVEPVLILIGAWLLLHERIHPAVKAGAAAALAGVGLIVYQAGATGTPSGIALTVAGVAACAGYTVACRKLMINDAVLTVVFAQQACAFAFAVVLLASVNVLGLTDTISGTTDLNTVSPTAWAAAGLSGVTYYGLAFWLYLTGLRHVPASVAGIFITLIPAFGITGGYLLLDERLNPRQWAGAVIVVLAVATVAAQQRPEPATAT